MQLDSSKIWESLGLKIIGNKYRTDNSFNYKAQRIKFKDRCRNDNNISFYYNAG